MNESLEELERRALAARVAEDEAKRQAYAARNIVAAKLPSLPMEADIHKKALAVEHDIFATYYTLMTDPEVPPAVRKACADALADRARGKPEQGITVSGNAAAPMELLVRREIIDPQPQEK